MEILTPVFVFIFGSAIGSFLNSIIYRLSIKKSFLFASFKKKQTEKSFLGIFNKELARSYCPQCKHELGSQDLIPILSFVLLRGKCRYCQKKISFQYPLVELACGLLFAIIYFVNTKYLFYGNLAFWFLNFLFLFFISSLLVIIFVYDFKHYIIPDKIVYPAIVVTAIWYLASTLFLKYFTKHDLLGAIYSAFGAASFFLVIVVASQGKWMGMGDVKLAFFMGLLLRFPNILVALFLAFFTGAAVGVLLILAGKKTLKSEVPFGPFLVLGTFLAMFFGQQLIDFYFSLSWLGI